MLQSETTYAAIWRQSNYLKFKSLAHTRQFLGDLGLVFWQLIQCNGQLCVTVIWFWR